MSKAAKLSIFILIFLVVGSLAFGGYILFEKQKLEQVKAQVEENLQQVQQQDRKKAKEIKKLNGQVKESAQQNTNLQEQVSNTKQQVENLNSELGEVKNDRDRWKNRIDEIKQERDRLTQRIQSTQKDFNDYQRKEREREEEWKEKYASQASPVLDPSTVVQHSTEKSLVQPSNNEDYWASILREKASLEIQIKKLKGDLSADSTDIVDLKQKNADMQIEIDAFKGEMDSMQHAKMELDREVEGKEDMINSLSLELARAKNDKKFVSDRVSKLNEENQELRQQLKRLFSSKSALEKKIVQLSRDKDKLSNELGQTETLIQSKIDEIWEIKDSIDKTIKTTRASSQNEVELTPIVVNSRGQGQAKELDRDVKNPGLNGKIVSINNDNNFVIVDVGESAGVHAGDILSVYRNSEYIARLEVIQVRKNISAADLKDQWSKIQVGDVIR